MNAYDAFENWKRRNVAASRPTNAKTSRFSSSQSERYFGAIASSVHSAANPALSA